MIHRNSFRAADGTRQLPNRIKPILLYIVKQSDRPSHHCRQSSPFFEQALMSDAFSLVSPVLLLPDWHFDVSTTAIQPGRR
jgi:hypothetical protein